MAATELNEKQKTVSLALAKAIWSINEKTYLKKEKGLEPLVDALTEIKNTFEPYQQRNDGRTQEQFEEQIKAYPRKIAKLLKDYESRLSLAQITEIKKARDILVDNFGLSYESDEESLDALSDGGSVDSLSDESSFTEAYDDTIKQLEVEQERGTLNDENLLSELEDYKDNLVSASTEQELVVAKRNFRSCIRSKKKESFFEETTLALAELDNQIGSFKLSPKALVVVRQRSLSLDLQEANWKSLVLDSPVVGNIPFSKFSQQAVVKISNKGTTGLVIEDDSLKDNTKNIVKTGFFHPKNQASYEELKIRKDLQAILRDKDMDYFKKAERLHKVFKQNKPSWYTRLIPGANAYRKPLLSQALRLCYLNAYQNNEINLPQLYLLLQVDQDVACSKELTKVITGMLQKLNDELRGSESSEIKETKKEVACTKTILAQFPDSEDDKFDTYDFIQAAVKRLATTTAKTHVPPAKTATMTPAFRPVQQLNN